jgi:hypothetical protein
VNRRCKIPSYGTTRMVFGDAAYDVSVFIDMPKLLRLLGVKAVWSKAGKATVLEGSVVVTAKQSNIAKGTK